MELGPVRVDTILRTQALGRLLPSSPDCGLGQPELGGGGDGEGDGGGGDGEGDGGGDGGLVTVMVSLSLADPPGPSQVRV